MSWKLKQGETEYICDSVETLKLWAQEGRIKPDNYIFNPTLQKWLYANEILEINNDLKSNIIIKQSHNNKNINTNKKHNPYFLVFSILLAISSITVFIQLDKIDNYRANLYNAAERSWTQYGANSGSYADFRRAFPDLDTWDLYSNLTGGAGSILGLIAIILMILFFTYKKPQTH